MKTYALIPARGGSKGVKNKNIRLLNGKPLIAYSIESAIECSSFDRVIVTTDSPEIAEISKNFGAEVPFMRPLELAQDKSPDRSYIDHALDWFFTHEKKIVPDLVAILRPTTPLRDASLLDQSIKKMKDNFGEATSLRSVHELPEPPQKMLKIENKWLTGFFPEDTRNEYFNLPRQMFPKAYQPNGYIDIVKPTFIQSNTNGIFGPKMVAFETPYSVEIDMEREFNYLEFLIGQEA